MSGSDDVIWIWWYDRQGAIQTEGINFVQDLPRFLILLFAFQRFGLEDWGFNNSLDTGFDAIHPSDVASRGIAVDQTRYIKTSILRASGEWEDIDIDTSRQVHQAYGLVGRGTSVFCGTAARLRKVESSSKRHMAGGVTTASKPSTELREVTAKIHWQEEPRLNEAEGLREASRYGQTQIPWAIIRSRFTRATTLSIRQDISGKSLVSTDLKSGVLLVSSGWLCSFDRDQSLRWSARHF